MNKYNIRIQNFIKYRIRFVKKVQAFIKDKGLITGKKIKRCTGFSYGESAIWNWLKQHLIQFEFQKRFNDCRDKLTLPFDFYLPTYNLCIEYQGSQHYDPGFYIRKIKNHEKGLEKYLVQKKHDEMKKEYCMQKQIKFLEIKYNESIENRLKEVLYGNTTTSFR